MNAPVLSLLVLLAAVGEESSPSRRVYAGVYLEDVSGFDLKAGRFQADLQVWLKWLGDETPPPVTFTNGELESRDEVARDQDGDWRSVRWRVQGTFRGTFPVQNFPFDTQKIALDLTLPVEEGELVPDLAASGMSPEFSITGWLYEPWFTASIREAQLASDLGSVKNEGRPHRATAVSFAIELRRPLAAYILKFILPLAIILGMAMLAAYVPPSELEVRSGIGVTALLSCIAFHVSQADSLPEVSYLVSADKLFLGSYVLILATLIETVVAFRLETARFDRLARLFVPAVALAGALLVIYSPADSAASASTRPEVEPTPTVSSERKELRVATTQLSGFNTNAIGSLLRRGLVYTTPSGEKKPFLAREAPAMTNELVRFLPDGGMRVRWVLRENLRWSDGQPITIEDVAFSAALIEKPTRVSVTIVDPSTVDIRFRDRRLAHLDGFGIYPKTFMEPIFEEGGYAAVSKKLTQEAPPGDGPYVVASMEVGKSAVFRRNPHFSGTAPEIETIQFRLYPTSVAMSAALLAGEVDVVPSLSVSGVAELEANPGFELVSTPPMINFIQPDLSKPPFDDLRVRRAILQALDRDAIAQAHFGRFGVVTQGYRAESAPDFEPATEPLGHDPERAREVVRTLASKEIALIAIEAEKDTPHMRAVFEIKKNLEAVGFVVELKTPKSTLEDLQRGDHGGLLFAIRRDGTGTAGFWNIPYKDGRYQVDVPVRLWDQALVEEYQRRETTLFEERGHMISRRIQRAYFERLPTIPICVGGQNAAVAKGWIGLRPGEESPIWWNIETWRFVTAK